MSPAFWQSKWCQAELIAAMNAGVVIQPVYAGDFVSNHQMESWVAATEIPLTKEPHVEVEPASPTQGFPSSSSAHRDLAGAVTATVDDVALEGHSGDAEPATAMEKVKLEALQADRTIEFAAAKGAQEKLTKEQAEKQGIIDKEQHELNAKEEQLEAERIARRQSKLDADSQNEQVLQMLKKQQDALAARMADTEATSAIEGIRREDLERRINRQRAHEEEVHVTIGLVAEITALEARIFDLTPEQRGSDLQPVVDALTSQVEAHRGDVASAMAAMGALIDADRDDILAMVKGTTEAHESMKGAFKKYASQEHIQTTAAFAKLDQMVTERLNRLGVPQRLTELTVTGDPTDVQAEAQVAFEADNASSQAVAVEAGKGGKTTLADAPGVSLRPRTVTVGIPKGVKGFGVGLTDAADGRGVFLTKATGFAANELACHGLAVCDGLRFMTVRIAGPFTSVTKMWCSQ